MTALLVIAMLVVLIVVHEIGHFIAAKICGVRVQEFGVGYPPRALRFGKLGDTEYTLNWLLFGGFVRLFGDDGENQHGRGSFIDSSRVKQILILAAGVAMNAVAAWFLFACALNMGIPRAVDLPGAGVQLLVADVVAGSPAETAGLRSGDQLVGVSDDQGSVPTHLDPSAISTYVGDRGGKHLSLSYVRSGATSTAFAIPANAVIPGEAGRPGLGIGLVLVSSEPLSWSDAIPAAFSEMWNALVRTGQSVWAILVSVVRGSPDLSGVVGPVGLVSVVGAAAKTGLAQILALAGFISVNLAVINLIPIPALDGGRLVIVVVEAIRRKSVSKLAVNILNLIGVSSIVFLMVVVTYHDVGRLLA